MSGNEGAGSAKWIRPRPVAGGVAGYVVLGVLAVAVFIPAFFAAFVWDDTIIVGLPDQVRGFADIWLNPSLIESEGHYWPVVYTTFWVEYLLWGLDPVGYHVVNVVLHAANTMLIYALLRRLAVPGAWAAAAIFAVHPTHVDSVAWAIERKDVLSALFYLTSALAYIRWDERRRELAATRRRRRAAGRRRRVRRLEALYAASLALFALGLLSKSMVVTLPVMLLVYHWWRTGRAFGREAVRTVPFFAVAIGVTLGDLAYYRARESVTLDISLGERVQIVSRSFWHYVQKLLWPSDLLPIYPRWDVDGGDLLGWGLLLAGIAVVVGLWLLRDRIGRGPLAGFLFFGVTLAPALGLIDYGYMNTSYVADRFGYLAGIGLIALVVGSLTRVAALYELGDRLTPARALAVLCVPVLVVLGMTTWRQARNYETPERFFTHIVTNNPDARGGAYSNLGNAYREEGDLEAAIGAYMQSLENDKPNVVLPLHNLGVAYADSGDLEAAESYYRQALDLSSSHIPALTNLAVLLIDKGEQDEGEELLQKALRLKPHEPLVVHNLATLLIDKGDAEGAERLLQEGLDRRPRHKALLADYGLLLHNSGRWDEAEPVLRRALDVASEPEGVAQALATALVMLGRDGEAAELVEDGYIESLSPAIANVEVERGNDLLEADQPGEAAAAYRAALDADPDNVSAHVQLGVAYENLDRVDDALASYRRAYEIDAENISAVYFLALLSARVGESDEALALFHEAETLFERGLVPLIVTDAELPELADVHLNRGVVLAQLGRLDEALADVERSLELNPGLELAAYNREQILGLIGQRDERGQ